MLWPKNSFAFATFREHQKGDEAEPEKPEKIGM
jgi:hypothetical protein